MTDDRDTPSARHELHDRWAIMPWLNNLAMTQQAVLDCLSQTVPMRVLLIDQGASEADSNAMRVWVEARHPRVLLWTASPPMLSLGACWNRGLEFVWETGATEALVVNNDVRLHRSTIEILEQVTEAEIAWFVSCVGVREGQFDPDVIYTQGIVEHLAEQGRGGPDFSCFLLQQAGHFQYPFEESLIPAYCEDLDMHRRYLLGGDGPRIFGVNLPFLHYASGTIKAYTPEEREAFNRRYRAVVARYTQLWGGGPSEERWTRKGDPTSTSEEDVTTPALHRKDNEAQEAPRRAAEANQAVIDSFTEDADGEEAESD